jgi:glycosyltransferase involved in cell wall biosynthesis
VVTPTPWPGTAPSKSRDDARRFDVVFVLPIAPDAPRTGGELLHRRLVDGLVAGGMRVGIVTRADLLGTTDAAAALSALDEVTGTLVVDTWLYRDLWRQLGRVARASKLRLVTLAQLCYWRTYRNPLHRLVHRARMRRMLKGVDLRVGVSRSVLTHDGASRDSRVIYPGSEFHGTSIRPADVDADPAEIVSVANYHPRKGFHVLVEALGLFGTMAPALAANVNLRLVGDHEADPAYVERLRVRIRELGLESNVTLQGWTDRAGVSRALSGAQLYSLASTGEGFGMVAAEALLHGLPAVLGNFETATELLGDSGAGVVVSADSPAAFAAAWLEYFQRESRQDQAARARRRGAELARGWHTVVDDFRRVLEEAA